MFVKGFHYTAVPPFTMTSLFKIPLGDNKYEQRDKSLNTIIIMLAQ